VTQARAATECLYVMTPYRSDEHVLAAQKLEQTELAALARDARARQRRAAMALGAIFTGALALLFGVHPTDSHPALHCHHVEMRFEQASGTPPPPARWTACSWR
jgi:hypothetical protein